MKHILFNFISILLPDFEVNLNVNKYKTGTFNYIINLHYYVFIVYTLITFLKTLQELPFSSVLTRHCR